MTWASACGPGNVGQRTTKAWYEHGDQRHVATSTAHGGIRRGEQAQVEVWGLSFHDTPVSCSDKSQRRWAVVSSRA
jgi:hypothetical protein